MSHEEPVSILLVDDRPENLLALEAILGDLGHNLVKAHSGDEALKCLLQQDFAAILLDVQMPGMDGFETAEMIRGRERSQHTPIIFLTALDRSDARMFRGYAVGAVDVIFKPFIPDVLRSKVAVFVELFRKTQAIQLHAEELEDRVRERTADLIAANEALHSEIAERKRAEAALEFLAEASRLLAHSLDYETTLQSVARLSVPLLADWCAVDIVEEDRSTRELVVHADPAKLNMTQRARFRYPADPQATWGVPHTLRTGQPQLVAAVDDSLLASIARDQEHLALLHALGARSCMCVPLIARGNTLGALTFVASESGRRYGPADLQLAQDLARRAALAVDNARLYRESQEAVLTRDEFLSIASHELKTPLTSLQLQVQTLLHSIQKNGATQMNPERLIRKLQVADRQSDRLASLINELLDVSRIRSGRIDIQFEQVDLTGIVRDVLTRFEEQIAEAGNALRLDADPSVELYGDRSRLEQVVTNLLSNAIKYGQGLPIEIRVKTEGDHAVLTVRDEGIGIAPEHLERIFVRFERAVSSDKFGGLGLGLYIVHQIVEALGGTIRVSSVPDSGATFTVMFPLASIPADATGYNTEDQPRRLPTMADPASGSAA